MVIEMDEDTIDVEGVNVDLLELGLEVDKDYFIHRIKNKEIVISTKRKLENVKLVDGFVPITLIGGFRYTNLINKAGFTQNGIYPNSVWDEKNRPTCDPKGMFKLDKNTWLDIDYTSCSFSEIEPKMVPKGKHLMTIDDYTKFIDPKYSKILTEKEFNQMQN